jgi:hypothetical protein
MLLAPQSSGLSRSIDLVLGPPSLFVSPVVQSAMVQIAERYHPFVACLAPERSRLDEAEVMSLARCPPADEAW